MNAPQLNASQRIRSPVCLQGIRSNRTQITQPHSSFASPRLGLLQSSRIQQAKTRVALNVTCNAAAAAIPSPSEGVPPSFSTPVNKRGFPVWLATIRAICFYITTFAFAFPLFFLMLAAWPIVLVSDRYRRRLEHVINNIWARLTTLFYYPVKIEGLENLPPSNQPAVYVSNHLSFLDIYTLFHLNRDFKFISKTSNFLIPIIGWSMFLTGHVMLNRVDRKSQIQCLKQCGELLKHQASVLFFPEGTRSNDGRLYGFKKGAFSVAAKAKVPVVPITLVGTGDLMPNKKETQLYPGAVRVVIHPAIQPGDAEEMMDQAFKEISSALPADRIAVTSASGESSAA